MRDGIDEYTLLCEDCGYVIEGLPREGSCPECGKPIAESLPERRTREPWHRYIPFPQYVRPALDTIVMPRMVARDLSISSPRLFPFWRFFGCAIFAFLPLFMPLMSRPASADGLAIGVWFTISGFLPAAAVGLTATVLAVIATWTESVGLRAIGHKHRYRVTASVSRTVCSSATVGWIFAILLYALTVRVFMSIELVLRDSTVRHAYWQDLRIRAGLWSLVAILPGFLAFETLAYIGLLQCKFANRQRPTPMDKQNEPRP